MHTASQPKLQFAAGIVGFLRRCRKAVVPSTALIAPMTEDFVKAVHRFARRNRIPWVDFVKGQRKDDVTHEHLARFVVVEGVLFVGRAQEKATVFQTEKRSPEDLEQRAAAQWVAQTRLALWATPHRRGSTPILVTSC